MVAPVGRSNRMEIIMPISELTIPKRIERIVIWLKVLLTNFAVADGITRNEATRKIPTNLTETTIDNAIRIESR